MMTIAELAEVMEADLIVKYNPWYRTWQAFFEYGEEKLSSGGLRSSFGEGATPEKAILNYVPEIRGKVLVFNDYGDNRREFKVPMLDTERISE